MKNEPLTEREIKKITKGFAWVILISAVALWLLMSSCTVLQPVEKRPDFEIEWEDTITIVHPNEDLFTPNVNDFKIIGISKNGKRYEIQNGLGMKCGTIKIGIPDSSMIGARFISAIR